ncbi:MAG: HEAT repeat domain-containing protein [Candidatus Riflebacteria bacterium]|nr:HEAT repeat domain-containing protein [Candidatus Riflebacteria bacterium]
MIDPLLQQELEAPIRSFRLFAIEKIIQESNSQEILDYLISRQIKEDDPECLTLLDHAITILRDRIKGSSAPKILSSEDFLKQFHQVGNKEKILLLNSLPPDKVEELAVDVFSLLSPEQDMIINLSLLLVFRQVFPAEHLSKLLPYLRCNYLSMRLATLEILAIKAPENLKRDLPKFLLHKDPRIRSLAIRGLAKIDLEEALRHLELLLESGQTGAIMGALQNSVFLPFDRVKPMFLKTLALAQDPDLLLRIEVFLENNPDPEIPYRLWELLKTSTGKKREILQTIFQRCKQNIEKSQILGDGFPNYLASLDSWIQKRTTIQWFEKLVFILESETVGWSEILIMVKGELQNPHAGEAFQEALTWPVSEKAQNGLKKLSQELAKNEAKSDQFNKQLSPNFSESFSDFSHDEKVIKISGLPKDEFYSNTIFLKKLLQDKQTPTDICATTLNAARRLENNQFVEIARLFLRSRDFKLAQAVIDYLGEFDFDWIFPFLGSFLQSENIRVKGAAIRLLSAKDPKQSISSIRALLFGKKSESTDAALACLVYFDFIAIREFLHEFLKKCENNSQFELALFFFKANPDPENLFLLFQLEKNCEIKSQLDFAGKIGQIRRENFDFLKKTQQVTLDSWENSEKLLKQRFDEDEERKKMAPAPYSVQTLTQGSWKNELLNTDFHRLRNLLNYTPKIIFKFVPINMIALSRSGL